MINQSRITPRNILLYLYNFYRNSHVDLNTCFSLPLIVFFFVIKINIFTRIRVVLIVKVYSFCLPLILYSSKSISVSSGF